jgi:general transcription factor 3C polypeptide 3 (transcription factor C subunit 4)
MLEPEDRSSDALLWDYPDLFRWVADTLHTTGHDRDALRFYEPVLEHHQEQLGLKSMLGLHTCYKNLGEHNNADTIISKLKEWDASYDDLAILAKFFEDQGMHQEARQRAETVYLNKGAYRLRKVQYGAYEEVAEHFKQMRRLARGKHSGRKAYVRKYMKKVKIATNTGRDDFENEGGSGERPSLGPLGERPSRGLFRAKGRLPTTKPQTFLQLEPNTLEGTNVSLDNIEQRLFRQRLTELAADHADELLTTRAQHRAIVASFERLDQLCDAADDGQEQAISEYLSIGRELVEEFSTFDIFYSDRRHAFRGYFRRMLSGEIWKDSALMVLAVEANRIADGGEERELREKPDDDCQDFYGVHFDKWVDVFGRFALLLGRRGEKDRCFSVLDVALQSTVFHRNQEYHCRLELCRLACALVMDDSLQASTAVRWLLKAHPFNSELFRLFSIANRFCSIPEGYSDGKTQRVLMRYIKTMDYVLLSPEQRIWFNFKGDDRSQWIKHAISSQLVDHVKEHDPALLALYGHVQMCGGNYIFALNYYFRAFTITPEDPAINLAIGIAYIQHAMKRGSENRQFQIQQGLSFINQYYELRTKDDVAVHCSEAEYNVGRIWHALGLMTQAIAAYERCIALSERVRGEAMGTDGGSTAAENFAAEAAFGIQSICVLSGDFERACNITVTALVIE